MGEQWTVGGFSAHKLLAPMGWPAKQHSTTIVLHTYGTIVSYLGDIAPKIRSLKVFSFPPLFVPRIAALTNPSLFRLVCRVSHLISSLYYNIIRDSVFDPSRISLVPSAVSCFEWLTAHLSGVGRNSNDLKALK